MLNIPLKVGKQVKPRISKDVREIIMKYKQWNLREPIRLEYLHINVKIRQVIRKVTTDLTEGVKGLMWLLKGSCPPWHIVPTLIKLRKIAMTQLKIYLSILKAN